MKRLLLFGAAALACFGTACGGGNSFPPPPPVTGNFSNASLKGTYAFSMSGSGFNNSGIFGFGSSATFVARVGSFVADGSGNITMAMEDVTNGSTPSEVSFSGGTYTIQANGTGTLTLNSALGGGLQLSIALNNSSGGVMIQTDLNATSSGSFSLQTPSAFTQTALNGPYVFDFSGTDSSGAPLSIVGQIATNGGGGVSGGVMDVNDGNGSLPSGAQPFAGGGSYALDASGGNGANFGRGTITFNGLSFAMYIVDGTHFKAIEEDQAGITFGDAIQQTAAPTQNFSASLCFLIGGSSILGNTGAIARGGRFTLDASGTVSNIQMDDNNNGGIISYESGTAFTGVSFAVDTTANVVGSGRATVTFTGPGQQNAFSFVLYLASSSQGFIQDTSPGVIGDGSVLGQSGNFSAATLASNYVFNFSGINLSQTNQFEEDFDGQYALSNSGGISGEIDFVELGSSSSRSPAFLNIPLTGSFTLNGDGTGVNTYAVTTGNSPPSTLHFHAYLTTGNVVFLVDVDNNRTTAGNASPQTQ